MSRRNRERRRVRKAAKATGVFKELPPKRFDGPAFVNWPTRDEGPLWYAQNGSPPLTAAQLTSRSSPAAAA